MRVNVYAEELTDKVLVVEHTKKGALGQPITFKGVRIMLEMPVTGGFDGLDGIRGPYIVGDEDCSSAITIWGDADGKELRRVLTKALAELGGPVE